MSSLGAPLRRRFAWRRTGASLLLGLVTVGLCACAPSTSEPDPAAPATDAPSAADSLASAAPPVPEPDMTDMEPQVAERFRETRNAIVRDPTSADAWGRFAMVAHAHELWDEAGVAYRQAEKLDFRDERWPYFLGDVLSVVGTDLDAAAEAFRRAMKLRPDYAPAHLRLGRVLYAAGQSPAAARELERALALEGGLQPARVTLGQIRLAEGKLGAAATLLEEILRQQPRHAQALATLGQVYMRQGRRQEARKIAERARDAAQFNLFEDPLMSKVVVEGVSSILIWDRAKAFLDNGNDEQARRGLLQVIALQPENADAHQQLAIAYGNLGDLVRSRQHLERAVALAPDRVDALIQLATVQLEQQQPGPAIPHLKRILELAPDDPDARWLLGRAQVTSGDVGSGLATFEQAATAGGPVPVWARNEWGSALAQSGRPEAALEQFRAVITAQPNNAQALFYTGLVFEGLGRIEEAVEHYCRSMRAQPNPPAGGRLTALGRSCR
ncbi:MAG: tetratricopeptide repeat protein [Acidobacteriota bacterium]